MELMAPLAYGMRLAAYLLGACLVWSFALLLAINPRRRPLAKRLAAAVFFSFPGVFLFRILAGAGLLMLLIGGGCAQSQIPQENPLYIPSVMFVVYGAVGGAFFASALGFVVGWAAGWCWASGQPVREFIRSNRFIAPLTRLVERRIPVA